MSAGMKLTKLNNWISRREANKFAQPDLSWMKRNNPQVHVGNGCMCKAGNPRLACPTCGETYPYSQSSRDGMTVRMRLDCSKDHLYPTSPQGLAEAAWKARKANDSR